MKGSENQLLTFLEGANNQYIIPVYQRNYDWKKKHCQQLYEDLKKTIQENKESHFLGVSFPSLFQKEVKLITTL